jgi:hypothetical protein
MAGVFVRVHLIAAALAVTAPGLAMAQGPSGTRFESLATAQYVCAPPGCSGLEARRRPSRLARSVLIGAAIGAGIGLLGLAVYRCDPDSNCHDAGGRTAAVLGYTIGLGTLIGFIVGATEPSHGPVPVD